MHLNSEYVQPPVDCPLLIEVEGSLVPAIRREWEVSKDAEMRFTLQDGSEISGRYRWTYP